MNYKNSYESPIGTITLESAVGWNPICLIIPWHKVVAQNGKELLWRYFEEKYLLNLEKGIKNNEKM